MDGVDGFIQARSFTGAAGRLVKLWVVHDEEYPEKVDAAWDVARFFSGKQGASAHASVDDRNAIGSVDWKDIAWHSGHGGTNNRSIGIEHSGYASQTREEWLDEYGMKMLDRSARLFAEIGHGLYGIPAVKLSPEQVANGEAGICGHADVTYGYKIYGGHTDPGKQFPWDVYIDLCNKHIGGAATGKSKKMFSTANVDGVAIVFGIGFGCVTHRWQGAKNGGFGPWAGLHEGQPFAVDGVEAFVNADGRMDLIAWNTETNRVCYRTQNVKGGAWRPWREEL
jgi:hypothetical protein